MKDELDNACAWSTWNLPDRDRGHLERYWRMVGDANRDHATIASMVGEEGFKVMTYDEIKKNLRKASRLIREGDVAAADSVVRSMVGKGLSKADLDANFTKEEMRTLREYSKGKSRF